MKISFPFETRIADFLFNPLSLRLLIVHNGTLSIDQLSSNLQNTNEQKSIYLKGWQEKRQSIHFLGLILKSKNPTNPHISTFILAWDTLHDHCIVCIICALHLFWISNNISYSLKYYWTFSNAKSIYRCLPIHFSNVV